MTIKTMHAKVVVDEDTDDESLQSDTPDGSQGLNEDADDERNVESGSDNSELLLNEGWADSIAKILRTNKPKNKRSLVLSRAKKLTDPVKKVITENYEVATADGRIIKEKTVTEEQSAEKGGPPRKKIRELRQLRVKPDILQKDRERTLQKIATKGVVQLFNVVRAQQKDIKHKLDEAGPLEVRKEKVLKNIDRRAFLDMLMGEKSSVVDQEMSQEISHGQSRQSQPSWDVLRDDFLLSAKIKDWDKQLETNSDKEIEQEVESD